MLSGRAAPKISKNIGDLLLVASITKTLSESGTRTLNLSDALQLTPSIFLQILSNPSLHPSKKLDFFNWSRSIKQNGVVCLHSPSTYSTLLRTLSRSGYLNEIPSIFQSMAQDGVVLDSYSFKHLLDSSILSGDFILALQILDYMEKQGNHKIKQDGGSREFPE